MAAAVRDVCLRARARVCVCVCSIAGTDTACQHRCLYHAASALPYSPRCSNRRHASIATVAANVAGQLIDPPKPKGFGMNNLGSVTPWTKVRSIGGSWVGLGSGWVWEIPGFVGWLGWRVCGFSADVRVGVGRTKSSKPSRDQSPLQSFQFEDFSLQATLPSTIDEI